MKAYKGYPKLIAKLSSGVTLCEECHNLEHRKWSSV
ncbi:hypothetical protein BUY77_05705 [Staphylococcus equorum]|nr:hypothetical protein BUY77_05705 [Staphylococcus equorum]RIL46390.1 hypothetical protein BUY82_10960 [Staphylococcus equorum]